MTIDFKQQLIYKKNFFIIINGTPRPCPSNIRLMEKIKYMLVPGIPHVFFLLGTLTRIQIAIVSLLNAICSEILLSLTSLQLFTR